MHSSFLVLLALVGGAHAIPTTLKEDVAPPPPSPEELPVAKKDYWAVHAPEQTAEYEDYWAIHAPEQTKKYKDYWATSPPPSPPGLSSMPLPHGPMP